MTKKKPAGGNQVNRRLFLLGGVGFLAVGAAGSKTRAAATTGHAPVGHPGQAADRAIAYARSQIGAPYVYGGTSPDGWDCSGLVQAAYGHAGVSVPRTSEEQWAAGPQVSDPRPGDSVFFPGADGTWDAPGHVALFTGLFTVIEAYDPAEGVVETSYGQPSSLDGTGPGDVIGYTRPWAG